ncbi:MAG: PEP-CTERM sorting domain-containing protein [Cyanobacteriota bacterium]|nr:PEP-CTERM sorting domain-containing protein [Cyanobacteriota bacterium]
MNFPKHSQFKSKARYISSLAFALVSLLAAGEAKAASFTFTKIADNSASINNGFKSFGQGFSTSWSRTNWYGSSQNPNSPAKGLAINEKGEVAFFANLKTGGTSLLVNNTIPNALTGNNKTVATTINPQFTSLGQGLSFNEKGEVAFFGNLNNGGGQNIFIGQANTTNYKTVASTNDQYSSFAQGLSLNDYQEVAFFASLDAGGSEIFKSNGTTTTQITDCSGGGGGVECPIANRRPSINNNGTVAFAGENGIFSSKDGVTTNNIMSDPASFQTGRYHDVSINNSDRALYRTGLNNGYSAAILSSSQTHTNIISGNTDPLHSVSRSPAINDNGEVAFVGEWNGYRSFGIFTGMPDPHSPKYSGNIHQRTAQARADMLANDKVVATGDSLFGSTVTALSMDRESMNKKCQIAFWARLANGTEGIYRAEPGVGQCQTNPLMPDVVRDPKGEEGPIYEFINQAGRRWFDPPSATGFNFEMTGDSLFTEILSLPGGFDNPFTVSIGDIVVGEFTGGDSIDFVSLLGTGVKQFSVSGINVDPTDPTVFPIKLDFDTELASFNMQAIGYESDTEKVPEPGTIVGLFSVGAFLVRSRWRREQKKK